MDARWRTRFALPGLVWIACCSGPAWAESAAVAPYPEGEARRGAARILVNGRTVPADVPPRIVSATLLVPLRFISEALGAKVNWDAGQKVATIRGNGRTVIARLGDATVR